MRSGAPLRWRRYVGPAVLALLFVVFIFVRQAKTQSALNDVIELVERSGAYGFSADITQYQIPSANPRTIGAEITPDEIYIEGHSNLDEGLFDLTFFAQGGSILEHADGVAIKNDAQGRLWARQSENEWHEVEDFSSSIIPGGDFLHFLAGAKNVVDHGQENRNGVTFTRLTFDLDSAAFAKLMRDQLQDQLQRAGELPLGANLELSETFTQMRGSGELWIGEDGLPIQQINHLVFPEEDGFSVDSKIIVTFNEFNPVRTFTFWSPSPQTAAAIEQAIIALVITALAMIPVAVLLMRSNRRWVYNAVAFSCTLTMVVNQPLMAWQGATAHNRFEERRTQHEADSAEREFYEEAQNNQETQWVRDLAAVRSKVDSTQHSAPSTQHLAPNTQHSAPSTQHLATIDSDLDGLMDAEEALIGTFIDDADSDDDGISDFKEIQGFSFAGETWYTNPLEPDTNNDGVSDNAEWNSDELDIPNNLHATWDLDGDDIPDLFDRDNDGDGVPDHLDLSPFTAWDQEFSGDNPFLLQLDGLTNDAPTVVDLQIRPKNPDQLWYAFNPLNWPSDQHGNIRDLNNSPDDVQIVPMLEIVMPTSPFNLPVREATIDLEVDTPDIEGMVTLRQSALGTEIDYTLSTNPPSYRFGITPGRCAAAGTFVPVDNFISLSALLPDADDTVTISPRNLSAFTGEQHALSIVNNNGFDIVACVQIPLAPFDGDKMIDSEFLGQYGIAVRSLTNDHSGAVAYVPVSLIVDDPADLNSNEVLPEVETLRGGRVAFQAQMPYQALGNWGAAHQVNLVWQINVDLDEDCTNAGPDCVEYEDQTAIVNVYEDELWQLTGLSMREERGVRSAIIHEIPADDPDLADDSGLVQLATSLSESFVAGRTDANGHRDITISEIERRWDNANALNVTITETMALTQPLTVETFEYESFDKMLMNTGESSTALLETVFGPLHTPAAPISPTLLYAYEWDYRSVNLDMEAHSPLLDINGSQMTIDLSDGAQARVTTIANVSMQPYRFDATEAKWEAYAMDDWFDELERRYRPIIDTSEPDPEQANGQMAFIQYFYATMQNGQQRAVQIGDDSIQSPSKISDTDGTKIWKGASTGLKTVWGKLIKTWVTQFIKNGTTNFFKALNDSYINGNLKKLNTLVKLDIVNDSVLKIRFKTGLIITGIVVAVGLIVAQLVLGTVAKFAQLDDATKNNLSIATLAIGLINSGWGLFKTIKSGLETFAKAATSLKAADQLVFQLGALGLTDKMARAANATAIIGFVVSVGVALINLIVQLTTGAAPPGSPAANTAGAVFAATVIVTLITTIIGAIPIVGQIIMAIIGIIDALLQLICKAGVDELKTVIPGSNDCFSLIGAFTKALVAVFYQSGVVLSFEGGQGVPKEKAWPQLNQFTFELADPTNGFVEGNGIRFSANLVGDFAPEIPPIFDAAVAAYTPENISRTTISAELNQTSRELPIPVNQQLDWQFRNQQWPVQFVQIVPGFIPIVRENYYTFPIATPPTIAVESDNFVLDQPGINAWYHLPVFLNIGMDIPVYECRLIYFCNGNTVAQQISEPVANYPEFALDILPSTLDAFFARDWGAYSDPRVDDPNSGLDEIFPDGIPNLGINISGDRDFDGDGLQGSANGNGLDVNDLAWDSDDDGLPDGYEADINFLGETRGGSAIDMLLKDTDADGICDTDELIFGSNPTLADSDGDGLLDAEEVWHQNCTSGAWSGGWLFNYGSGSVRVTSNPIERDSDGDGLSDKAERDLHLSDAVAFAYHPQVVNDAPVTLDYQFEGGDLFFAQGETFVYTTTIENSINAPYYADGTFSRALPAVMGGGQSDEIFPTLFDGDSIALPLQVTVDGAAPTQLAAIQHAIDATLKDSANDVVVGPSTFTYSDTVNTTIDDDLPTSSLTRGLYVKANSLDVIGGSASDPTSYITGVEVEIGGSFTFTEADGAEVWAINWLVPAAEGRQTISVRATDAVGNVQSPVTTVDAIVDGTAPIVTSNLVDGAIIRPKTTLQRNAGIPISGTVSDPMIGTDLGSGVRDVMVKVEPLSLGWFTATIDTNTWEIIAPLASIDSDGNLVVDHTGSYTATIRTIDNVGNSTAGNDLTLNVLLDDRAPETTIDSLIQRSGNGFTSTVTTVSGLTQTNVISGMVVDNGSVSSGIAEVEVAFVPAIALDGLDDAQVLLYLNEANGSERFFDTTAAKAHGICREFNNRCPVGGMMGQYGDAQQFNGTTSVIEVPTDISAQSTIALWFQTNNDNSGLFSLGNGFLGNAGHDADVYLVGGNVCARMSAPVAEFCSVGVDYANDQWHQVVLTIDPATQPTLYVDGQFAAQANAPRTLSAHTTLYLGFSRHVDRYLDGLMDEFAVYNGSFSAEQVEALYQPWRTATLAESGAAITQTTWSLNVPYGLDGEYQIDLRASDVAGNRNDERRGTWNKWRGIIDTRPPELELTLTYFGDGDSAETRVDVYAEDFNLVIDGFSSPCGTPAILSQNDIQIIDQTCTLDYHLHGFFAQAAVCDVHGNCVAQKAANRQLFIGSGQGGLPNGADRNGALHTHGFATSSQVGTSAQRLLDWQDPIVGLDVDVIRNHLYWMAAQNGGPAALYRSTLDGSGVTLLKDDVQFPTWNRDEFSELAPGVAVNDATGKLYFTEGQSLNIANLDLSGLTAIHTHDGTDCRAGERYTAFDPAIDTTNGKIYWLAHCVAPSDYFSNDYPLQSEIWMANLDGSNALKIYETDFSVINAVQIADGKLYWFNAGDDWTPGGFLQGQAINFPHGLWSAELDGSMPTHLTDVVRPDNHYAPSGLQIDPGGENAYVTGLNASRQVDIRPNSNPTGYKQIGIEGITAIDERFDGHATALAIFPPQTITNTDVVVNMVDYGAISAESGTQQTVDVLLINTGILPAGNGTFSAQMPDGATLVNSSLCGSTLSCAMPILAANETVTVSLTIAFGAGAARSLLTASVDYPTGVDASPLNNSAARATFLLNAATPTPSAGVPVVLSNNGGGYIWRTNLETGGVEKLNGLGVLCCGSFDRFDSRHGVAIDWTDQHVYFTTDTGLILRGDLNGVATDAFGGVDFNQTIIANYQSTQQVPTNIALYSSADDSVRTLYYTLGNELMALGIAPAAPAATVTTLNSPIKLIVDSARELLVWQTAQGTLHFANLDGSEGRRIPVPTDIKTFDLDIYGNHIYLLRGFGIAAANYEVVRTNFDGSNPTTIVASAPAPDGEFFDTLLVDAADNTIYVGDSRNRIFYKTNLAGADPLTQVSALPFGYTGRIEKTWVDPTPSPTPLLVATATPQPTSTPVGPTPTPFPTPPPIPSPTPGGPPAASHLFYISEDERQIHRAPTTGCSDGSCVDVVVTSTDPIIEQAIDS